MKRILVYKNIEECPIDFDVITPVDYNTIAHTYLTSGGNAGNKVHYNATYQYITNKNIEYQNLTSDMTSDYINNNFDLVIFPTANILNPDPHVIQEITDCANIFKYFKIPVYPIGVGCQACSYNDLDLLVSQIKEPAYNFIKSVYDTGGEFALRGYFTKEFFDKLGFHSAVVTGCPSLYQNGRDLQISNDKASIEDFRPLLNGNIAYLNSDKMKETVHKYKNSVYICQEQFLDILYSHKIKDDVNLETVISDLRKYTYTGLELLSEDRVKLFYDFPVWKKYIKDSGFNFSYGARIHGNIIALLCFCPAMIEYTDTRVQELAQFFDIPCIAKFPENKNLYDLYLSADYTKFNQTFAQKFDNFERFLSEHDIVNSIQDKSLFSDKINAQKYTMPTIIGKDYIEETLNFINDNKLYKRLKFKKYLNKFLWKISIGKIRKTYKSKYNEYKMLLKIKEVENPCARRERERERERERVISLLDYKRQKLRKAA